MPRKTTATEDKTKTPREATVKSVSRKSAAKASANDATQPLPAVVEITDDMIRARAHQLWLEGVPGSELDHWFHARKLLESELGRD
jgi:hypothetical protein